MKQHIKSSFIVLLMVILSASNEFAAQAQVLVDVKKTFSGIERIEVSGGSLEVEYIGSSAGSEILVNAFLESNNPSQDIIFVTLGDVLKISYQQTGNSRSMGNIRTKGHIKISGPEAMVLNFQNGSGKIKVENINSPQTNLTVGSGMIQASKIRGDLQAKSGSGSIKLNSITGDVKCTLGSGSADINEVKGDLHYSSGSGRITAKNIEGLTAISLTSGSASLVNIGELGELKISSGSIRAENAGLGSKTHLSGSSGSFRIQTPSNLKDFNYSLKASSGSLRVGTIRTGRNLDINNQSKDFIKGTISSGSISIDN
ncbi:hypothetical protein P872_02330 [Rhodonellum psychrophilum GCM71 = DSM 17998]|uniref:DUF4097 domain-containing protein n=2 Tax=Rhodonellum TaxID=336827 RepID=U5C1G5_9BACT|nr:MULTISPECIES: DUF4097 family beta strand repeat-containing protein [Rhodonellum]ERM83654.1 hypothetical protein P872_02330 [Rhodonellum psychrophilum GCM71 = DSM 17998]SDY91298.1 Putative adhesin [Rhodonellum ikkaensis]